MKAIKYIFFDIGYTLVNEDVVWRERCREQAATPQAQQNGITAERLWNELQTASGLLKPQWKYVGNKFGFTESAKYKSELETLYDDTHNVLESLSKKFRLGIIANQSGGLTERLRSFGIGKYFSTVISSSDYGIGKPDKRLFTIALEKSGVEAHNAVMIGDRLDNDILPANELGFTTVHIKQGFAKNQLPPSDSYKPTYVVNNLTEILALPFVKNKRICLR
ncbi:MAG: HAD family hydrolase [Clostridiales bacterium]|nr:HAD family hydrolase [Clostridiales bacterium]